MDVTSSEMGGRQAKWLDQVMVRSLGELSNSFIPRKKNGQPKEYS